MNVACHRGISTGTFMDERETTMANYGRLSGPRVIAWHQQTAGDAFNVLWSVFCADRTLFFGRHLRPKSSTMSDASPTFFRRWTLGFQIDDRPSLGGPTKIAFVDSMHVFHQPAVDENSAEEGNSACWPHTKRRSGRRVVGGVALDGGIHFVILCIKKGTGSIIIQIILLTIGYNHHTGYNIDQYARYFQYSLLLHFLTYTTYYTCMRKPTDFSPMSNHQLLLKASGSDVRRAVSPTMMSSRNQHADYSHFIRITSCPPRPNCEKPSKQPLPPIPLWHRKIPKFGKKTPKPILCIPIEPHRIDQGNSFGYLKNEFLKKLFPHFLRYLVWNVWIRQIVQDHQQSETQVLFFFQTPVPISRAMKTQVERNKRFRCYSFVRVKIRHYHQDQEKTRLKLLLNDYGKTKIIVFTIADFEIPFCLEYARIFQFFGLYLLSKPNLELGRRPILSIGSRLCRTGFTSNEPPVMWLQLLFTIPLLLDLREIFGQEDLEIVGSDNHFIYHQNPPKIGAYPQPTNFKPYPQPPPAKVQEDGRAAEETGFYRSTGEFGSDFEKPNFDKPEFGKPDFDKSDFELEGPPKIDFPVKTVQKFTDADGNVKIITSYSNRDDNPLPIYKDTALREKGLEQARNSDADHLQQQARMAPKLHPTVSSSVMPPYASQIEPRRSKPAKQEFSTTKSVKLPNQDGHLFANQHEITSTDGQSSSYNQKASFQKNYKKKPKTAKVANGGDNKVDTKAEISSVPLEVAGSSYISDVDDGPSFDGYAGGSSSFSSGGGGIEHSDYGGGGGEGGGEVYDGGSYDDHGPEDHDGGGAHHHGGGGHHHHGGHHHGHSHGQSFKKGHGSSHHHADKASKGEEGGKGFKKQEKYEKGHSETHGHEEEKGGKKEESGAKAGHLVEGNEYAKGHKEGHGSKGSKHGHSKGHKKGHKTKGFRTVHHKDEYKKDEVFYDEEHDAGHHKGHGQDHQAHKHAKGGSKKKGHLNSGYKHAKKGHKADQEKGHSYKGAKGHSGSHGSQHHHSHHSHHDKAAGHKGGEAHGHEHHKKGH
ncbi:unnamed protein product [Nesidiocoris tenuis]|uniref:Uncharacterized protein n=1 Tax=Nesidiocoris tenuis TaxID=355587 RepID=A0A6H5GME5_9HEMI|nr:unnamed protein product [Nesidiocoris tenuis]